MLNLLAGTLPSILVFYLIGAFFAKSRLSTADLVMGFFACWAISAIASLAASPDHSIAAAQKYVVGISLFVVVAVLIAMVHSAIPKNHSNSVGSSGDNTAPEREIDMEGSKGVPPVGLKQERLPWGGSQVTNRRGSVQDSGKERDQSAAEEVLWATVAEEFDSGNRRSGLWARVFAESNGDEPKAKAMYLKIRFAELRAKEDILRRKT